MRSEVWTLVNIEQVARALVLVQRDQAFQAGVLALVIALGCRPEAVVPDFTDLLLVDAPAERR